MATPFPTAGLLSGPAPHNVGRPLTDPAAFWELTADLFAVVAEGRFVEVNPAWKQVLGWTRSQLIGRAIADFVHVDDLDTSAAVVEDVSQQADPRTGGSPTELRLRAADGTYRWLLWSASSDGTSVCSVGVDITERKRATAARDAARLRSRRAQVAAGFFTWEWDPDRDQAGVHAAMINGTTSAETGSIHDLLAFVAPSHRADAEMAARRVAEGLDPAYCLHWPTDARHGEVRWMESRGFPILDEAGVVVGVHGTTQDITEVASALAESERAGELRTRLLDEVDASVIATDLDGVVTHWNRGAQRLYGWTESEAVRRSMFELTPSRDQVDFAAEALEALGRDGRWEGEIELERKGGSPFIAYVRIVVFEDADGAPAGLIGVSTDASARVKAERELRETRDYLRAVTDSMGEALCTLDVEGRVTYVNAAAELLLGWPLGDLRGRILHDTTHHLHADGSPYPFEDCPLMRAHQDGRAVRVQDDVFIRRDGSKVPVAYTSTPFEIGERRSGSVVVFTDITTRKADEARLREEIESLSQVRLVREALDEDRFRLFAQPIVDLGTGKTVQHELLIRMLDRDGELVLPGRFLPAAEHNGFIREIDRWVIGQAARLVGQGHAVEINLSAWSLDDPELFNVVRGALAASGADPAKLVIELTETALLRNAEMAITFIERVTALGCQVALDDFGTGYGGFTYVKRLPVAYLKIDQEFVRDIVTNAASRHVVHAVVSLARGFGQCTVAEGVEDVGTTALLSEMGVDLGQGYGLGRPVPVTEALA